MYCKYSMSCMCYINCIYCTHCNCKLSHTIKMHIIRSLMPRPYVHTRGKKPVSSKVCFTLFMATLGHPTIQPSSHQVLRFWRPAAEAAACT